MQFPAPFVLGPPASEVQISFPDFESLDAFFTSESSAWHPFLEVAISRTSSGLQQIANNAKTWLGQFKAALDVFRSVIDQANPNFRAQPLIGAVNNVTRFLGEMSAGITIWPSTSGLGAKILDIGKTDPKGAMAFWAISPLCQGIHLGNIGAQIDVKEILNATRYLRPEALVSDFENHFSALSDQRARYEAALSDLKDKTQVDLAASSDLREKLDEGLRTSAEALALLSERVSKDAEDNFQGIRDEWRSLKDAYDTQLALLAPTTYWNTQARSSRRHWVWSAVVFAAVACASLLVFMLYGIPRLAQKVPGDGGSVLLHILPIVVPAFLVIWVMKIISKLMSGYLQRADDANERRVMVMTFLALMRNRGGDGPLVNDQDRILILHALFRPSSVTPTDDAPPVHWFDLLTSRQKPGG